MYSLTQADILGWTASYDGPLFHGLLSDPPYHLTSVVKRFGKKGSAPAKPGKDGAFSRVSRGFLGQEWDGGDVAFRPETWAALLNLLHPGAFGFAFSASRNFHRLAIAIEDAGAVIHPAIFGWVQGQSLPKATQILDPDNPKTWDETRKVWTANPDPRFKNHRYGGQILKQALEPIICFQKPYQHKPQIDIIRTGAGALNIKVGRIQGPGYIWGSQTDIRGGRYGIARPSDEKIFNTQVPSHPDGRWPSNFYTDLAGAAKLDAQSGVKSSGMLRTGTYKSKAEGYSGAWHGEVTSQDTIADRGGISRFFYIVRDRLSEADPVFYAPKVKGSEKDAGLTHREPVAIGDGRDVPIDNGFQRGKTMRYCSHPTLKPLSLCRYLAGLLLPPEEYAPRRLLVPFAGVASEMIGGLKAGWDEVVGVELSEEYVSQGLDRLAYWVGQTEQSEETDHQLGLF